MSEAADRGAVIGDDEFRMLLEAELPRLRRVAARIAPLGVDTDDLTHDALERAWRSRASFRGDAAMSSWLYRIVHNRAADLAARRTAVPMDLSEIGDDHPGLAVADPAALLDPVSDGEHVRAALARLGSVDRVVVVLHDGEGMAVQQIADACGLTVAATHKRLQRARARLVQALLDPSVLIPSPHSPYCFQCREFAADYLNDELAAEQREQIEAHLRICAGCPPLAQAAIGLRSVLDDDRPGSELQDQITSALRAHLAP